MDFLIYIATTRMGMSIIHFKVQNHDISVVGNLFIFIENNVKSDKMLQFVAFYLDLQCLPNYLFNSWPTDVVY